MLEQNIQLFADGGETGAGNGSNAAAFDVDAELQKRFPGVPGFAAPKKAEAKDEAEKQDAAETQKDDAGQDAAATEESTQEDAEKAFEELIKGKYKDQFGKRVQGIINDRFKTQNAKLSEAEKKAAELTEAILPYLQKLGVDPNDPEAVKAAVMDDKSNFRAKAVEQGITIEEAIQKYRDERASEKEKQAQLQEQQRAADEAKRRAQYDEWLKGEAEIRQTDPSFDLAKEYAGNDEFRKAIQAGMSVQFAYRATHYEQQMAAVAGAVERQTALNTAQQIANRQNRPVEGGLGTTSAVAQKNSYKDLSDKEFMKLFKSMGF